MTPRETKASPGPAPDPGPAGPSTPEGSLGLRLRIWVACLSGALVSSLGIWWVAGTELSLNADPARLLAWFAGLGALGLLVGIGFALWLDHGVVAHLRGLTRALASGRVQELRGLPAASGWGELSRLTEWAQVLISRQRLSQRASHELETLEATLTRAIEHLEAWRASDRWEALPVVAGPGAALARELNESVARAVEMDEQNFEAARRVHSELIAAAVDARESAAQAERGFVEATALLTTVRELQRLGQELRQAMNAGEGAPAAAPAAPGAGDERLERYRAAVESSLEELIASSNASVEHLGVALRRVQEIAAQVQTVSQRATLVALHAVTLESRLPREERRGEELSHELRLLTAEVRAASQQADALAAEVERQTRLADESMRSLRPRVGPKLEPQEAPAEAAPPPAAIGAAATSEQVVRLLERVREMIQDSTRKGERLSASGERASRTAQKLLLRLEDEAREVVGLMVRLSPAGGEAGDPPAPLAPLHPASGGADLRLLEEEVTSVEITVEDVRERAANDPGESQREELP